MNITTFTPQALWNNLEYYANKDIKIVGFKFNEKELTGVELVVEDKNEN